MSFSAISPRLLFSLIFAFFSCFSDLLGLLDIADLVRCPGGEGGGFFRSES